MAIVREVLVRVALPDGLHLRSACGCVAPLSRAQEKPGGPGVHANGRKLASRRVCKRIEASAAGSIVPRREEEEVVVVVAVVLGKRILAEAFAMAQQRGCYPSVVMKHASAIPVAEVPRRRLGGSVELDASAARRASFSHDEVVDADAP